MHPVQYAEVLKWTAAELDHVTIRQAGRHRFAGRIGPFKLRVRTSCPQDTVMHYDTQGEPHAVTMDDVREMVRRYVSNHGQAPRRIHGGRRS